MSTAAATRPASTPLQRVLYGAPLAECLSADFKKRTLTFKLEEHHRAEAGAYHLVPAIVAQIGIEQEQSESIGGIHLNATDTVAHAHLDDPYCQIVSFACGGSWRVQRLDAHNPNFPKSMQPPHWFGEEIRIDNLGRHWSLSLGKMVMDDYGFLVRVSE